MDHRIARAKHTWRTTFLLVAALLLASPLAAVAAQAPAPTASWEFVDVGAQYLNDAPYCLVGGELATGTPLPAAVELAVPASSTAVWVGEVALGQPGADKELPHEVTRRGTMDVYSMTLQGSRLAQVEALIPGLITLDGDEYKVSMAWVAPEATPRFRIAVAVPPNAQVIEGGEAVLTASDAGGTKYYYREVSNLDAGESVSLNLTYSIPTAASQAPAAAGGAASPLWWVLGFGLVLVAILVVAVVRQQTRAAPGDEDAEEE